VLHRSKTGRFKREVFHVEHLAGFVCYSYKICIEGNGLHALGLRAGARISAGVGVLAEGAGSRAGAGIVLYFGRRTWPELLSFLPPWPTA
jgi:hypothetical protein